MTMDKLFDGSDAHLLPGNAELIQRLRYERDDDERYEAADARLGRSALTGMLCNGGNDGFANT